MNRLCLYGAGGHGKVIAEIAEALKINVEGFIDTNGGIQGVLDYPVVHSWPDENVSCVISIGNNNIRRKVACQNPNLDYKTLIHPSSIISSRSMIEEGSVVMAGVTVNSYVQIGKHCIINTNASVDHECVLEDFVHISPNVGLAGNVRVGEGTHVGIGANVIQGITIGKWCTIGAGAVVIRDVPDGATVVGNPGRILPPKGGV